MLLRLEINYRTQWGEEVRVYGSLPELGNGKEEKAIPLHTADGRKWTLLLETSRPEDTSIEYAYLIYRKEPEETLGSTAVSTERNNGAHPLAKEKAEASFAGSASAFPKPKYRIIRREWDRYPRRIHLHTDTDHIYHCFDAWRDIPEDSLFYSGMFTSGLMEHSGSFPIVHSFGKSLVLKAFFPRVSKGCCIGLLGAHPVLGGWDPQKIRLMNDADYPEWRIEIDATHLSYPTEYKFVLYDTHNRCIVAWEEGPNRRLDEPQIRTGETAILNDVFPRFLLPEWKGAGVAVPVFSLRSEQSFGIGDFADLRLFIDWAAQTRQKIVQLLPIADTTLTHTWMDSYPYNSISIYALNPMYLAPFAMGCLNDQEQQARFEQLREELNAFPAVDYEAVDRAKWEYFRLIYAQDGAHTLQSPDFQAFLTRNESWLLPYAVFSHLRDLYHTSDFSAWPRLSQYSEEAVRQLCSGQSDEYPAIALYLYLQYHLHLQLSAAAAHARKQGVVLKGDIPIGISRCSVEAWKEPQYFNLDSQAGAPPDAFSIYGQNWGFPTYNWFRMAADGYQWWERRFQKMAEYFSAYRIDHILGFFRIWEIPAHSVRGLLGQFAPALPLTAEEIESYGLPFRKETFIRPFIHESLLDELFGNHAQKVKDLFIRPTQQPGVYEFRPEYDTQRKVETYFRNHPDLPSETLRDGLYTLLENVLFLPDHKQSDRYHPRIHGRDTYLYRFLPASEREAFDRIHEHFFYHRHNTFWQESAMQKLPRLIGATSMLPCGEDLGMIPACVPHVMEHLHILSLEIQRMPKGWEKFARPEDYPYRSVSAISTHDMSTLRGWWEENPEDTQTYYHQILGHRGEAPARADGRICQEIVRQHLQGRSMLCILALQDWLSIDQSLCLPDPGAERINIPANPRHYWRYRMHLPIEELLRAEHLNTRIRELIQISGRNPKI